MLSNTWIGWKLTIFEAKFDSIWIPYEWSRVELRHFSSLYAANHGLVSAWQICFLFGIRKISYSSGRAMAFWLKVVFVEVVDGWMHYCRRVMAETARKFWASRRWSPVKACCWSPAGPHRWSSAVPRHWSSATACRWSPAKARCCCLLLPCKSANSFSDTFGCFRSSKFPLLRFPSILKLSSF